MDKKRCKGGQRFVGKEKAGSQVECPVCHDQMFVRNDGLINTHTAVSDASVQAGACGGGVLPAS